jgi:DEAD/DEAH box helicase domain-containing protein
LKNLKLPFDPPRKFDPFVIDVETQKLANEVEGGWNSVEKFKVSVAVSWDLDHNLRVWYEEDAANLIKEARNHYPVVSFNGEGFDFRVLSAYGDTTWLYRDSVDLLKISKKVLGHRVHLDSVAKATLGKDKTASGLDAVAWWRSGDPELRQKVIDYCKVDVAITRDLYFFAKEKGYLLCEDFDKGSKKYYISKSVLGVTA